MNGKTKYFEGIDILNDDKGYRSACLRMINDGNYNGDPEIRDVLIKMNDEEKEEYYTYVRNTKQSNPSYETKLVKAIRIFLKRRGIKDETAHGLSDIFT